MIGLMMLASAVYETGNTFYQRCAAPNAETRKVCEAFVAGTVDMITTAQDAHVLPRSVCVPKPATLDQLTDISIKWLRDNPDARAQAAAGLVAIAVEKAFPCPK